jgi:hypothetical protein
MSQRKRPPEQQVPEQDGPNANEPEAGYTIWRRSTFEVLDALSLHVLARAYRSAWRVMYNCEPQGWHAIETLDLLIEFRD